MRKSGIIFLFFILLLSACNDDHNDFVCTEEFRTESIKLQYTDDTPYLLDSFKVFVASTGREITIKPTEYEFGLMRKAGIYPVIDDNYVLDEDFAGKKTEVIFVGYVADMQSVKEYVTVGADRCHILYFSGSRYEIFDKIDCSAFKNYLTENKTDDLKSLIDTYFSKLKVQPEEDDEYGNLENLNLFIAEISKCSDVEVLSVCYACIETLPVMSEFTVRINTDSGHLIRTIDLLTKEGEALKFAGVHE